MIATAPRAFLSLTLATTLILALVWLTTADARGMYRWVDEQGNVHFSDQRPSGRDAERVGSERRMGPEAADETPAQETTDDTEDEQRRQQQERYEQQMQENEKQREAADEHNRQLCERIEQELARLQQGGRFRAPGQSGDPEYLSDEQIQERIANNQRLLEEKC